ncbi:MAG TPA: class II fructose-bisphosphate aldolase [Prolixibacteraceae bacterium]|nr:class II fructose-bisphosphate aldolase [Prolixibacteraceae bacterium]
MLITGRTNVESVTQRIKESKTSLPIFCTGSHWNTEAILLAAKNIGKKYQIENVPVAIAMTFNYEYMPQAQRMTYTNDARLGFLSNIQHLKVLAGDKESPYYGINVLPHLDHADPVRDKWALTEGTDYLASVMFDAQKYPIKENVELTTAYVKKYSNKVLIEGIMDELSVFQAHEKEADTMIDNYPERAFEYVKNTKVDYLVADLGTEQQSNGIGKSVYLKERALNIRKLFADRVLVLHGTSCLSNEEIGLLPDDGILRVNMWTRIARDAGLYAIDSLKRRESKIADNNFNAIESHQYLMDSIEKAASIMEEIMESLGYANLK